MPMMGPIDSLATEVNISQKPEGGFAETTERVSLSTSLTGLWFTLRKLEPRLFMFELSGVWFELT